VSLPLTGVAAGRDDQGSVQVGFGRGSSEAIATVRVPVTPGVAAYTVKILLRVVASRLIGDTAGNNSRELRAAIPYPAPIDPLDVNCTLQ
jgi:hypothetical protein